MNVVVAVLLDVTPITHVHLCLYSRGSLDDLDARTQEFVECVEHDKMEKRKQRGQDRDSWHRYPRPQKILSSTGAAHVCSSTILF